MSTTGYDATNPRSRTVETTVRPIDEGKRTHVRISWAAIIAGVILVIATQLLLSMIGIGVGLGMVDPTAGGTPGAGNFGIGAGVWWLVSSLIALAFGAYAASWLAGLDNRFDGVLHGLVIWGISTLLTFYLLTSAVGGLIGGAFSVVGSGLSAAGSGISAAAPKVAEAAGVGPDVLQQQAQAYLQPASPDPANMTPQEAQKAIASELPKLTTGTDAESAAAKDRIINITAAQANISKEEATQRFNEAQARAVKAKNEAIQKAKVAADKSAAAASTGSFLGAAALLLGAIAAAIGGAISIRRRSVVTTDRRVVT